MQLSWLFCLILVSASNFANAGGFLSRILDPEADVKEQIDQARAEQEAKDQNAKPTEHRKKSERGAAEYRQREDQRTGAEQEAQGKLTC